MKRFLGMVRPRRSLLLVSAFAPMCFGVLMAGAGPSQLQGDQPSRLDPSDVKIINNTTTLDATFQITANNHLLIRLRNISSKNLNGYVIATSGARIKGDISSGDSVVRPGETTDLELPIQSSSETLTVLAAMFADGNIEANPVLKKELTEWRTGLKKELARGLKELESILNSPDVYSTKALDELEPRLSPPLHSDTSYSYSESGTRSARDSFSSDIQSLRERAQRSGTVMQRQRLLDLKGRIERRIASL